MEKVDIKDRKILYELDLDSRQSLSQLGKKVGLSRDIVTYRMQKLKERGIIKNFYTVIDPFKIGYTSLRFTILFQNTIPELEEEIIDYFVSNKYTAWVASAKGQFDLSVIMWIKDMNDFHIFWKKTLIKYRDYFQEQEFSIFFQTSSYHNSYLLSDEYNKSDRENFIITGIGKRIKIDDLDLQILKTIASNARIPSVEIAARLNSTAITITKKIKNLMKLDVIQGFRVNIDFSKIGYVYYKVDIQIKKYKIRDKIIKYVQSNPHLVYLDETAGSSDLELSFIINKEEQLHQIMKDIITKFPDTILNYKYYHVYRSHKLLFLPEG